MELKKIDQDFSVCKVADYTLVDLNAAFCFGILSGISGILAENKIGIFVVSTFNTDYVLTKKEEYQKTVWVLGNAGYKIIE